MFEQKCRIKELTRTMDNDYVLSLTVPGSIQTVYDEYNGKELRIKLDIWKEKRSLDQNAYFWKFCGVLAAKLRLPPEEVYQHLIQSVGDNYEVVCVKSEAAGSLIKGWKRGGLGWIAEEMPSKLPGCTNVVLYYGSSTYDTKQMNRLIELLIAECKAQEIDTRTLEEQALLREA